MHFNDGPRLTMTTYLLFIPDMLPIKNGTQRVTPCCKAKGTSSCVYLRWSSDVTPNDKQGIGQLKKRGFLKILTFLYHTQTYVSISLLVGKWTNSILLYFEGPYSAFVFCFTKFEEDGEKTVPVTIVKSRTATFGGQRRLERLSLGTSKTAVCKISPYLS